MDVTLKKIARECFRPLKQIVQVAKGEKNGFRVKLKDVPTYHEDWLVTSHNTAFMHKPSFLSAYQRGVQAGGKDYGFRWRVHIALWVASQAAKLEGSFVECGVYKGFLSSAIMHYLNWNQLDKSFYLFDTYQGFDFEQVGKNEKGRIDHNYPDTYEWVKKNFSEFKNVHIVRGSVPSTLTSVKIDKVSYLSIDMNCAEPEIAAAKYFWPKLVSGGFILLDDYAYRGFQSQQEAFDAFAQEMGTSILSLPTGQGLLIKR